MGEGCGAKCNKTTAGDAQRNADVVKVSVGIHPLPHGPVDGADTAAIDLVEDRNVAVKCSGLGFGGWCLGFGVWDLGFGVWGVGFGVWVCNLQKWELPPNNCTASIPNIVNTPTAMLTVFIMGPAADSRVVMTMRTPLARDTMRRGRSALDESQG